MLKKNIKYKDYNGVEQSNDFYFNLSKGELAGIGLVDGDDLQTMTDRLSTSKDRQVLWDTFVKLVTMSYGRRSGDGARFVKNADILEEFTSSEAYSELLVSLFQDNNAANFVNGIVPEGFSNPSASVSDRPVPQDHLPSRRELREAENQTAAEEPTQNPGGSNFMQG